MPHAIVLGERSAFARMAITYMAANLGLLIDKKGLELWLIMHYNYHNISCSVHSIALQHIIHSTELGFSGMHHEYLNLLCMGRVVLFAD